TAPLEREPSSPPPGGPTADADAQHGSAADRGQAPPRRSPAPTRYSLAVVVGAVVVATALGAALAGALVFLL
ncbi:MAG: hypothetical protein JRI23_01525, partial [Deltaproteobacteria bacterium]|nr:hypothetical protein [Deltaproteobacteria bacterium]MBW2530142.1 hypothetical protein [Deltaproteobacteria bacterium]